MGWALAFHGSRQARTGDCRRGPVLYRQGSPFGSVLRAAQSGEPRTVASSRDGQPVATAPKRVGLAFSFSAFSVFLNAHQN